MKSPILALACLACSGLTPSVHAEGRGQSLAIPDFTQGATIPANSKHDWNLGPTGLRGWMFCYKMVTTDARQISTTKVDPGSPADGVFAVVDVLLGVAGKPFSFDPRTELGRAITLAETENGGGKLALTRWRSGKEEQMVVKLPVLGSYSATAPYGCEKSRRIFEQGIKTLAARIAEPDCARRQDPITR